MPFLDLKQELASKVSSAINHPEWPAEAVLKSLEVPPNPELGHLAFPCFRLAKVLRKAPPEIAKTVMGALEGTDVACTVAGPYVNFKFSGAVLFDKTVKACVAGSQNYGHDSEFGGNKKVVIEFCSPNIAKPLMFQHIRSILIGNVLSNIYTALGFDVTRMNFVGDWGTQFAKLLVAIEKWGGDLQSGSKKLNLSIGDLVDLYVKFHKEGEKDASLDEAASKQLQALESGDKDALALWQQIRDLSLAAVNKTLARMNAKFDVTEGESQYIANAETFLQDVKQKAGAKLSEGAWIVELEGIATPALIQKKDGTTLYLSRDVAGAVDRKQRYQFDKSIYVVGDQQRLHFQQLFGILRKMGFAWAPQCEHVGFGTVLFGAERMSTREGRFISLDSVLDEAKKLAFEECSTKNPELKNKDEVAEKVGLAALVFGELSAHRQRDIEFDWKHVLAFDGETGPYVQYAAVRTKSLLEKAVAAGDAVAHSEALTLAKTYSFAAEEIALMLQLASMRSTLRQAATENEPYHLTRYLIDTAKAFSRFYYHCPVLQADTPEQKKLRLTLVQVTSQVLQNGLTLLGVQTPNEM